MFSFEVIAEDEGARAGNLITSHGFIKTPSFVAVRTLGAVNNLTCGDLINTGTQVIIANALHLHLHTGEEIIENMGGLHKFMGWKGPLMTDSGGFQAYSLIRQNAKYGRLTDQGITFRPDQSSRKLQLTPEKTIQLQLSYGADIVICLDDCTHVEDSRETQQTSVQRTITWARRGQATFQRLVEQKKIDAQSRSARPL